MKRALKGYTGVDTPLFQTMLVQSQILQGEGSTIPVESHHTPIVIPSTSQPHHSPTLGDFIRQETKVPWPSSPTQTHIADKAASTSVDDRHRGVATTISGLEAGQGSGNIHKTPTMPHDSPLPRVHTLRSDEGRMKPNELMGLVTKLSDRVAVLENDLKRTKKTCGVAFTKLIKKVKTLEKTIKSSKARRRAQFVGRQEYDLEPNFEFTTLEGIYTAEPDISTANVPVSTAAAELVLLLKVYKNKKGFEEAQRLQEQFDEEERKMIASVHKEASTFKPKEWDNMQTQIEADEELAYKLQHMGNHTLQQLRGYSFDEIKVLFEATVKRVNTFTPMESDDIVPKVVARSSKRSAEEELETGLDIFMLVEKDYPMTRGLPMLMLANKMQVDQHLEMIITTSTASVKDLELGSTVTEDDDMSKEKEIDKLMTLISLSFKKIYKPTNNNLRTSSNTSRAHQDNTLRINKGTGYDTQRPVNVVGARENVVLITDESEDQCCLGSKVMLSAAKVLLTAKKFEAHYMYMAQIQEVSLDAADNSGPIFDTEPLQKEQGVTNTTIDSLDMSTNGDMVDQDDDDDLAKENLEKFQAKLDRYHDVNYASKVEIDCAKAKGDLL
ncbi:hypothetical protein Tco_1404868 [Tanacetum coccineum]